jgi:hypothetical protein
LGSGARLRGDASAISLLSIVQNNATREPAHTGARRAGEQLAGATRSKDFFNRPIFNDKEATKINELNNNSEQQPARSGVFGHNFVFLSKRIHVL